MDSDDGFQSRSKQSKKRGANTSKTATGGRKKRKRKQSKRQIKRSRKDIIDLDSSSDGNSSGEESSQGSWHEKLLRAGSSRSRLDEFSVPDDLNSPLDLMWHTQFEGKRRVRPCRILRNICRNKVSGKNSWDSDSDSSEEMEVTIEYLSSDNALDVQYTKDTARVSTTRLKPFHGSRVKRHDYDTEDILNLPWCEINCRTYLEARRSEKQARNKAYDADLEQRYLDNILNVAKERGGFTRAALGESTKDCSTSSNDKCAKKYSSNDESNEDDLELEEPRPESDSEPEYIHGSADTSMELEEPYTQAPAFPLPYGEDSDDDMMNFRIKTSKQSNEPIRPGDVLEYYNPIFVMGSAQGHRIATVLSIDPKKKDNPLQLSNGEILPLDTEVKRIKTMERIRNSDTRAVERVIVDHPGIYRKIEEFRLIKMNQPAGLNVETEQMRITKILRDNRLKMEQKAKASGFAPMDMVYKVGGGGSSSDGSDSNDGNSGPNIASKVNDVHHGRKRGADTSDSDSDSGGDSNLDRITQRKVSPVASSSSDKNPNPNKRIDDAYGSNAAGRSDSDSDSDVSFLNGLRNLRRAAKPIMGKNPHSSLSVPGGNMQGDCQNNESSDDSDSSLTHQYRHPLSKNTNKPSSVNITKNDTMASKSTSSCTRGGDSSAYSYLNEEGKSRRGIDDDDSSDDDDLPQAPFLGKNKNRSNSQPTLDRQVKGVGKQKSNRSWRGRTARQKLKSPTKHTSTSSATKYSATSFGDDHDDDSSVDIKSPLQRNGRISNIESPITSHGSPSRSRKNENKKTKIQSPFSRPSRDNSIVHVDSSTSGDKQTNVDMRLEFPTGDATSTRKHEKKRKKPSGSRSRYDRKPVESLPSSDSDSDNYDAYLKRTRWEEDDKSYPHSRTNIRVHDSNNTQKRKTPTKSRVAHNLSSTKATSAVKPAIQFRIRKYN